MKIFGLCLAAGFAIVAGVSMFFGGHVDPKALGMDLVFIGIGLSITAIFS